MHKAVLIKRREKNMIQAIKNGPSMASASLLASHMREEEKIE